MIDESEIEQYKSTSLIANDKSQDIDLSELDDSLAVMTGKADDTNDKLSPHELISVKVKPCTTDGSPPTLR